MNMCEFKIEYKIVEMDGKYNQWTMDNGQWTMDNGQWIMDNGQWIMDNG
jgi:hypothetical protein